MRQDIADLIGLCQCKYIIISVTGAISSFLISDAKGYRKLLEVIFVGVFAGVVLAPMIWGLLPKVNVVVTPDIKNAVVGIVSVISWNLLILVYGSSTVIFEAITKVIKK